MKKNFSTIETIAIAVLAIVITLFAATIAAAITGSVIVYGLLVSAIVGFGIDLLLSSYMFLEPWYNKRKELAIARKRQELARIEAEAIAKREADEARIMAIVNERLNSVQPVGNGISQETIAACEENAALRAELEALRAAMAESKKDEPVIEKPVAKSAEPKKAEPVAEGKKQPNEKKADSKKASSGTGKVKKDPMELHITDFVDEADAKKKMYSRFWNSSADESKEGRKAFAVEQMAIWCEREGISYGTQKVAKKDDAPKAGKKADKVIARVEVNQDKPVEEATKSAEPKAEEKKVTTNIRQSAINGIIERIDTRIVKVSGVQGTINRKNVKVTSVWTGRDNENDTRIVCFTTDNGSFTSKSVGVSNQLLDDIFNFVLTHELVDVEEKVAEPKKEETHKSLVNSSVVYKTEDGKFEKAIVSAVEDEQVTLKVGTSIVTCMVADLATWKDEYDKFGQPSAEGICLEIIKAMKRKKEVALTTPVVVKGTRKGKKVVADIQSVSRYDNDGKVLTNDLAIVAVINGKESSTLFSKNVEAGIVNAEVAASILNSVRESMAS